jgi:hypothetical protein
VTTADSGARFEHVTKRHDLLVMALFEGPANPTPRRLRHHASAFLKARPSVRSYGAVLREVRLADDASVQPGR